VGHGRLRRSGRRWPAIVRRRGRRCRDHRRRPAERVTMGDASSHHRNGATPDPDEQDPAEADVEAAQLEKDLDAFQRERDELLDTTRRLQADFENYRKRVLREQTALVERATEALLEQLLPVLDSFELAVHNLEAGGVDEKVR